ncbi:MAG: hypothetical protein NTU41_04795, partial [Chloroflexi bacterium]|nr:hypothetical protein [Chloroflexota bacterium]
LRNGVIPLRHNRVPPNGEHDNEHPALPSPQAIPKRVECKGKSQGCTQNCESQTKRELGASRCIALFKLPVELS